jgi:hypothetical protein
MVGSNTGDATRLLLPFFGPDRFLEIQCQVQQRAKDEKRQEPHHRKYHRDLWYRCAASFLLIVLLHGAHGKLILIKQTSVLIELKTTTYLEGADRWGLVNIVRRLGPGVIALLHSSYFMGAYKREHIITRNAEDETKDIPGAPLPSISRPAKSLISYTLI